MNIYTRTGDAGETSLFGGTRISKSSLRVWCYGSIDEANCALGMVAAHTPFVEIKKVIARMQKKMFVVASELASDAEGLTMLKERICQEDVDFLEGVIDNFINKHGEITKFVTPGETITSAHLHVARSTVRRAERYIITLNAEEEISPVLRKYVNRLSDALFALANEVLYMEIVEY